MESFHVFCMGPGSQRTSNIDSFFRVTKSRVYKLGSPCMAKNLDYY